MERILHGTYKLVELKDIWEKYEHDFIGFWNTWEMVLEDIELPFHQADHSLQLVCSLTSFEGRKKKIPIKCMVGWIGEWVNGRIDKYSEDDQTNIICLIVINK